MSDPPKTTWRCPKCGSDDIEILAWISVKDETIQTWDDTSTYWCPHCEEHFRYVCQVNPDGRRLLHEQPFADCQAG